MNELPSVIIDCFDVPSSGKLDVPQASMHKPRILILYGSLRDRSFSRFLASEAARLLEAFPAWCTSCGTRASDSAKSKASVKAARPTPKFGQRSSLRLSACAGRAPRPALA